MKRGRKLFAGLLALAAIMVGLANYGDVNAATLISTVQINFTGNLSNPLDLVAAAAPHTLKSTLQLASGVGAGQADVIFSDTRTIAASTTEDLDLKGGGLVDAFGVAINPVKVKAIIVTAAAANTNNVVIGGDANSVPFLSAATTTAALLPGGQFVLTAPTLAGIAVTAGTGDIIQVANSGAGTSVTYSIVVLGTSS